MRRRRRRRRGGGASRRTHLDELHEGLLDGVLARSAEHGVLEDVRDALRVVRRRPEHHAEGLVLVVVHQTHHLRAGLDVSE